MKEKRSHPRVACEIATARGETIRNISEGGLYLKTEQDYAPSSHIPVSVSLPPSNLAIRLEAQIVRQEFLAPNQMGYGLVFTDKTSSDYRQLQYFIRDRVPKRPSSF